ncbi:hypothetical protein ABZ721_10475 [Streptomyces sp. NPDC006733]|uniref:hypothetical protein n=1 Tax=Streptomyces sp. NPDC006733 TaxID=3155460 RepID=UPI0033C75C57
MTAPLPPRSGVPAAHRGALRLADRVPAKIAAQAAREVLADAPAADRVPRHARPTATIRLRGSTARIRLSLELGFPAPLGTICGSVRRHVTDRVESLTGLQVSVVLVEIERLYASAGGPRQRAR